MLESSRRLTSGNGRMQPSVPSRMLQDSKRGTRLSTSWQTLTRYSTIWRESRATFHVPSARQPRWLTLLTACAPWSPSGMSCTKASPRSCSGMCIRQLVDCSGNLEAGEASLHQAQRRCVADSSWTAAGIQKQVRCPCIKLRGNGSSTVLAWQGHSMLFRSGWLKPSC